MTIHGRDPFVTRARQPLHAALVIISLVLAAPFASAATQSLTTQALPAPLLTTVVVTGSSAYQAPQLFDVYRDHIGKPIARESARAVGDALVSQYERDGFVKPEVTFDDSLTGRGVLRVQVHEARVSHVLIEGHVGPHRETLEKIGARLQDARPLRKEDVPKALRSMRRIAGMTVTINTRRDAETRNAFELLVNADYSAVGGLVRMNNRGTDQVGPAFLLGQLTLNGMFGSTESLGLFYASAVDPDEYLGGGLYFDSALGEAGTRGNLLLFRSHSAPNESPVNYADEYSRQRAVLRVSHPLRQESRLSLSLSGAFEADDLIIDDQGLEFREDRLRILEGALRSSWRGGGATQYSANIVLRQGLDAFGAGLQALDLPDDPRRADFLLVQLSGSVYRRFATDWSIRFDGFAQQSGYVLPDSERFKIGGDRLGRGFEVAEIAGDQGLGGKLELRRDLMNTEGMFGRFSTYGFYDIGAAWKQDRPGRESAATAGVGFALSGSSLVGYVEVASPLTGPDIEGKDSASVFAELSYRF
jgi:hemolysin activation/secretion protein